MNKLYFTFLVIMFPVCSFASEYGKWIPHARHVHSEKFDTALDVAKKWANGEFNAEQDKISFEYWVRKTKGGYKVVVDNLYHIDGGGYSVAVDGDMCFYLDNSFKLKRVKQCMAP